MTTVWPATGIAQAALLLWGRRLWPAVWAGAFVANAGTDAPLWTAAVVATGNTLEAVATAWALTRWIGFDPAFRRTSDSLWFIVIAAGAAPIIAATTGVTTLCAAGVQPWARFAELWSAWWFGDSLGALVVAPAVLTMVRHPGRRSARNWIAVAALAGATLVVTDFVFSQSVDPVTGHHPLEYVIVPFVIVAAVRFRQPATALVVLIAAMAAIVNTIGGLGPLASPTTHRSLILLQAFVGMLAGIGLLLAAAIAERGTGERRRSAAAAVGEVLVDAADLTSAAPRIVSSICTMLEWPVGALWVVQPDGRHLRCLAFVGEGRIDGSEFAKATRESLFEPGVGLPGSVWQSGAPIWIADLFGDATFPRLPAAHAAGLRGAFAFPIRLGEEVFGVIELLHHVVVMPDRDLIGTMTTVGSQIGQFVVRKRVEAAVQDEQRRTRAMLETALDAVIGMDHLGRITEFNPAAEQVFGRTRADVVGRELADLLVPPQMREHHRAGLRRYLATGEGEFIDRRVQASAWHADGHEFPIELSITRVPSEEPPRFAGFIRDLTARVEAEREREQLLERELAARREAEAANRAKDEFLAMLSHELRTPLNAIVGWTRMLRDGTLDEASTARALEVIDRNAHLQAQLVADLLDVSRIITGGLPLERRSVDLAAIIGAALDAVRPAADAKQIQLRTRVDEAARVINGDPQRLQQVVWNLLANAVKFSASGGAVEIALINLGTTARIEVRDNGAGIDPAFLPFVFDRFRQADSSFSRRHGGLGLGLAIVRHLVELHGGTVRAASEGLEQGATFTVDLPVQREVGFAGGEHSRVVKNPEGRVRPRPARYQPDATGPSEGE